MDESSVQSGSVICILAMLAGMLIATSSPVRAQPTSLGCTTADQSSFTLSTSTSSGGDPILYAIGAKGNGGTTNDTDFDVSSSSVTVSIDERVSGDDDGFGTQRFYYFLDASAESVSSGTNITFTRNDPDAGATTACAIAVSGVGQIATVTSSNEGIATTSRPTGSISTKSGDVLISGLTLDFDGSQTNVTDVSGATTNNVIPLTNPRYFTVYSGSGDGTSAETTYNYDTDQFSTASIIALRPPNTAPTISGDLTISTDEGTAVTLTSTDLEADDPNDSGSALTYTVTSAPVNGTITVNGSPASSFTEADVNNSNVEYVHDGSETTDDAFDVELADDDGATSATKTVDVSINSVNDDPTVVTNTGSSTDEDTDDQITQSELEATDPEQGPSSLTYTIDTDVSDGQIQNTGTGIQLNQSDEFTQADINAGYIEYRHDGTEPISEGFDFTVRDGAGGSASGTFSITINQVNDAPTIAGDLGVSTDEGTAGTITSTDLEADDPDDSGSALTFTVTSTPSHGTIEVNGSAASTFTEADVNNGNVEYVHDGSETTSDAFDVELADDDGATSAVKTVDVTVNSVNDDPTVATNEPLSLRQGNEVTIPQRLLETTDTESGPSNLNYDLFTDVSHGQIYTYRYDPRIQLNQSDDFTQADINNGDITYQHDGSGVRSDYFEFTVRDGSGGSVSGTFDVVISPPPYGSGTALTLDGSGDYVSTGAGGEALGLANESFSIGMWFKANAITSSGDNALVGMDGGTNDETLHLALEPGGEIVFGFYGNDLRTSSGPIQTGTWQHLTFVYDATKTDGQNDRYIYLNGNQIASNEASADFQGTSSVLIGRWGGGNYFDGKIDQVRVWEDALTKSQVRTRVRRTIDVEGTVEQELVAAWRLDAGTGSTAYDVIAGRDGTLQGDADFAPFSGAGFGQASAALQSGSQTVGPSGGTVKVENVSTSGSDGLQVYQYGSTSGSTLDGNDAGEDFSSTSASKRLNVVWGLEAIGNASADVTLDYSQVQGLSDPSNVRLLKRAGPGDAWQNVSADWTWNTVDKTFSKSGVSSFSQYAIGEASSALPVELVRLEAALTDGSEATQSKHSGREDAVRLTWTTASETNNAGFEVQRRVQGGSEAQSTSSAAEWDKVGFVESKAEGGTTEESTDYQFTDNVSFTADTLEYRLRQVDVGGGESFSEPVTIARRGVGQVRLLNTYPNPARERATVRFAVPEDVEAEAGTLRLYDVLGREVRAVRTTAEGGRHDRTLDTSRLPSGVYFLRLQVGDTAKTQRLTVVR